MFSRSEKTDEVIDPMAEPSGQRSPMVLAALAGLLALAGAFLLFWYLSNGDAEVASSDGVNSEQVDGAGGGGAAAEANQQVLVVTQSIPRGTSVAELIAAPTVYLSARAVPEQFVAASAIKSVAELQDLDGLVLASEALPGEQLLRGRFRDPSDFESNTDTFLEDQTDIEIPDGHHAVVLNLPATRALGGLLRKGELVTVVMSTRVSPTTNEDAREVSLVVLNSVEVLNVDSSVEVAGQVATGFDSVGVASQGNFTVTLAVEPDELTDLTFAISYGEITLATAVAGIENDDSPRAATWMRQIVGDDGVWLEELDDGNVIGLVELFSAANADATSIEVDGPDDTEDPDSIAESAEDTSGDS